MGRVGELARQGRDVPVVIARDEIVALAVRSCPAGRALSLWSLACFPGGLAIDLPLDACSPYFPNCCRFGLCFDLRIAGCSCGVAPLQGIHAPEIFLNIAENTRQQRRPTDGPSIN